MPQPTIESVTPVDPVLTDISVATIQDASRFVGTAVAPRVPVAHQTGTIDIIDTENFFRDQMERRSSGDESAGSGYTRSTDNFYAPVWALHKDIGRQERLNQVDPVNLEDETVEFLTHQALQRVENEVASEMFATGIWDTDRTGGTDFVVWDDDASDPISEIDDQVETLLTTGAMGQLVLALGRKTFSALRRHPIVEDKFKVTNTDSISEDMLANVFDVDEVVVMDAVTDSSTEGASSTSKDFVVSKDALLTVRPPNPGLQTPAAAYTLTWREISEGLGEDVAMRQFEMKSTNSERFEIEQAFDVKVMQSELGVFFSGAVS